MSSHLALPSQLFSPLHSLISKNTEIFEELGVWHGVKKKVKTYAKDNIYITIPKAKKKYLKISVNFEGPIKAPIKKDEIVGNIKVVFKDKLIGNYELYAFESVKKQNIFSRLISSFNYLIWGDV